jgi:Rrf2 family protein
MQTALRISDAAALAFHAMAFLAEHSNDLTTTGNIASTLKVSEAHLSKVLQRLTKDGLVRSIRGPGGGFTLAKQRDKITLLEVFESIEGPLELSDCLFGNSECVGENCMFGELINSVNHQLKRTLGSRKLSDIAVGFKVA